MMKKYEEERYRLENIKENIYPWIKNELVDYQALKIGRASCRERV